MKVVFIVLAITYLYTKRVHPNDAPRLNKLQYWKDRVEFVFVFLMSILLLYLFNPYANNVHRITKETKLLLYLFGFILILTAQWNVFVTEAPWFQDLRRVLSNSS